MGTRENGYKAYGLDPDMARELKKIMKSESFSDEQLEVLRAACYMANPEIAEWLYYSLSCGKSYYSLAIDRIPISVNSFYGYQRLAIYNYIKIWDQEEWKDGQYQTRDAEGKEERARED